MTLDEHIERIERAVALNQVIIDGLRFTQKAKVMQKRNDERSQMLEWLKDYKRLKEKEEASA